MSEQTISGVPLPNKTIRKNIIVATLLFCWSLIVWLIADGKPDNSLHTSALAWAFGTSIMVTMAYVFGAVADNFNMLKSGKDIKNLD